LTLDEQQYFYLGCRLSKHEMTIYAEKVLALSWLHLWHHTGNNRVHKSLLKKQKETLNWSGKESCHYRLSRQYL